MIVCDACLPTLFRSWTDQGIEVVDIYRFLGMDRTRSRRTWLRHYAEGEPHEVERRREKDSQGLSSVCCFCGELLIVPPCLYDGVLPNNYHQKRYPSERYLWKSHRCPRWM